MKLSLKWLKEYVSLSEDLTPQEIADKLSTSGFEIEEVLSMGCNTEGIVIGYVEDCKRHPNADKLNVCQVNLGSETLQIVCGAPNVAAGQKVPVATVGTDFGGGFKIKKSKLRGEESNGMICSEAELGLSHEADGIMVLDTKLPNGTPIAEYFTNVDVQFDLSITPNRPDCLSHTGIAKELSVMFGTDYSAPSQAPLAAAGAIPFKLNVAEGAGCYRFTANVIKGVKIAESPKWLKDKLATVGLRSINNLVDISNYVMFELGQPLHFYDYDQISGAELNVRSAKASEEIKTLDDKTRKITAECIVIEDSEKFAGLAGMMGGADTEVSDATVNVLVEAAIWDATRIQRSQRDLGFITDASYRYSKGVDHNLPPLAQARAVELILELCGGEVQGQMLDWQAFVVKPHRVSFRKERCDMLIGQQVAQERIEEIFTGLSLYKLSDTEWEIPTYRQDLTREVDLIEEVARIVGLENIKGNRKTMLQMDGARANHIELLDSLRVFLVNKGLQEVMTNSMVNADQFKPFSRKEAVELENPISDEMNAMRLSLIPSMLKVVDFNLKHKNLNLKMFEIGKDYSAKKKKTVETKRLCIALSGTRSDRHWSYAEDKVDFYDAKGLVVEILRFLSIDDLTFEVSDAAYYSGEAMAIFSKSNPVATFGKIDQKIKKQMKLSQDVFVIDLNLDQILSMQTKGLKQIEEISRFPIVERDIAVIVKKEYSAEEMLKSIRDYCKSLLKSVEVFDIYVDKSFKNNEHSIAFKLYFSADRTLTESDIDPLFHGSIQVLTEKFGAYLRDA